jgi:tetratricopeptide (TPR) repeat protein
MSRQRWPLGLIPLALVLVSASPPRHAEELIRRGNDAFDHSDYDQALKLYEGAEERGTDPGLAAFNEGAALYRLGRFAEAEIRYRRALEGAGGGRQARALYNLGTCLLRQGSGEVKTLAEALSCFEKCLVHAEADPELRTEAAHNLELARLLWQQARQAAKDKSQNDQESGNTPAGDGQNKQGLDTGNGSAEPGPKDHAARPADGNGRQKASETAEETPGKGNLRPLPDRDELAPLTPEDVAAYLEQAAQRILEEQRAYRQAVVPSVPNLKDW